MAAKAPRFKSVFTVGGIAAEVDPLLQKAFFESSDFAVIESRDHTRCFMVGRTGSGKSAALNQLENIHPSHVIRINPENLSLPYITNLSLIKHLDDLSVNMDVFWKVLWKHVLLVEIIKHRYNVNTPDAKQRFLTSLMEKLKNDPRKRQALNYLEEFEGRFWEESATRIKNITDSLVEKITKSANAKMGAPYASGGMGGAVETTSTHETKTEEADRYQRIVNETQLAQLNAMVNVLDSDILDREQNFTYVIIDDLDREWVDERIANDLIRCLFQTVFDLNHVRNLKILVALRTNIFQELDFGKRGAGQEEKFRGLVLDMTWTRADLKEMLSERVSVESTNLGMNYSGIDDILPAQVKRHGSPLDYILDRTFMRPRDAISFINECLIAGKGKTRLIWEDIFRAEEEYSGNFLLSIRDEWKGNYPGIDQVIGKFRGAPGILTKSEISLIFDEVFLLLGNTNFSGVRWLTDVSSQLWNAPKGPSEFRFYRDLLAILYSIGLLGISTSERKNPIFFVDDPKFVTRLETFEKSEHFIIHRAFHRGLEIKVGNS